MKKGLLIVSISLFVCFDKLYFSGLNVERKLVFGVQLKCFVVYVYMFIYIYYSSSMGNQSPYPAIWICYFLKSKFYVKLV